MFWFGSFLLGSRSFPSCGIRRVIYGLRVRVLEHAFIWSNAYGIYVCCLFSFNHFVFVTTLWHTASATDDLSTVLLLSMGALFWRQTGRSLYDDDDDDELSRPVYCRQYRPFSSSAFVIVRLTVPYCGQFLSINSFLYLLLRSFIIYCSFHRICMWYCGRHEDYSGVYCRLSDVSKRVTFNNVNRLLSNLILTNSMLTNSMLLAT